MKRVIALLLALCLLRATGAWAMEAEPEVTSGDQEQHNHEVLPDSEDTLLQLEEKEETQPGLESSYSGESPYLPNPYDEVPSDEEPQTGPDMDDVYDPIEAGEALLRELQSDPGGVINLDGDVTLSGEFHRMWVDRPVTVNAGPHTVTVDTYLSTGGPITFTGNGTVLRVTGEGVFSSWADPEPIRIIADGDGAFGLYLEQTDGGWLDSGLTVSATGNGAVAIYAEGDWEFTQIEVAATGTGSTGIHTTGSASLLLCFVHGGGSSVVSDSGEIVLEGCGVRPAPPDGDNRSLHGTFEVLAGNWVTITGTPLELPDEYSFGFMTESGIGHTRSLPVVWDDGTVDWDAPGSYPLTGEVRLPFDTPNLSFDPLELTVRVVRGDRAVLTQASLYGDDFLLLLLREEIHGAWFIEVWCSDNGGESWRALGEEGLATFEADVIRINGLPDDTTYLFYLEVWGGPMEGASNRLEFYADPNKRDNGGEREGDGDKEDGTLPPVTDPPGGSSGSTRGGNGGTYHEQAAEAAISLTVQAQAADDDGTQPTPEEDSLPQRDAVPAAAPVTQAVPNAYSYPNGAQVWSAKELARLALANPVQITFHAGGLSADLPTGALLDAVDGGDFAIMLDQPSTASFRIRLYTGGGELDGLGGKPFRVSLPAPDGDMALECRTEDGDPVAVAWEGNRAVVTLTRTGTYLLRAGNAVPAPATLPLAAGGETTALPQAAAEETPQTGTLPVIWTATAAVLVLCAGAGCLLLRRRRWRRG